ncbi:poly ADP-ribose polymerase [Desmophyllum pertusum]|uniref:Poly ADP-ribose polymerase n=1 Tax=Desmophyllum pertusum TaxID=174260 RepID=A0A9X0CFF3_9CNID|nr:poly ADP-ribose polymerase [Desmophyllum pertusum]
MWELKRSREVLSSQGKPGKGATSDKVPSHWSSMPSDEQYKRVALTAMSSEYKEVEMLFKRTMKKNVTINSIERVQNPFMWEKYQR